LEEEEKYGLLFLQKLHQITFKEGAYLNRPPLLRVNIFSFWQKRMEIFIQSIDPDAWNVIIKDPFLLKVN